MASDCRNAEAVDFASSFGSAVLGTLEYDNDQHNWLLEFGHSVARYEYLRTYRERDEQDQAHLNDFRNRINEVSNAQRPGFNVREHNNVTDFTAEVRRFVKAIHKENSYALFLIAGCSWYLGKSNWSARESKHSSQLRGVAKGHLRELGSGCSSIPINQDVLWAKLNQKLKGCRENSIHDIRELLQELSRPLRVLLMSADPKDATSARADEERRSLGNALKRTIFRDHVNVEDAHGCHHRDISFELTQRRPDILQFLGHGDENGLYFEDENSNAKLVLMESFADLLGQYKTIKLVILNTCYSKSRGQCIADAVGTLIAMEGKIRNKEAIEFTRSLYGALGNGYTVEDKFYQAGKVMKLDTEARFQAHLLRRGRDPTTISTSQPASGARNDYRGLSMKATHWPFALAILLSVLATAVSFRNDCSPDKGMVNLWSRPWNASGLRKAVVLDYFSF
ncbi:hypothetical protein Hte_007333 [Hypoxylon texense]